MKSGDLSCGHLELECRNCKLYIFFPSSPSIEYGVWYSGLQQKESFPN